MSAALSCKSSDVPKSRIALGQNVPPTTPPFMETGSIWRLVVGVLQNGPDEQERHAALRYGNIRADSPQVVGHGVESQMLIGSCGDMVLKLLGTCAAYIVADNYRLLRIGQLLALQR